MRAILCLALLLVTRGAAAQDVPVDRIDAYVRDQMASQHIPGIAIAVVRKGTIALAKGYGLANVEHQVAVKSETVFQSGSVGKQVHRDSRDAAGRAGAPVARRSAYEVLA